MRYAFLVTLMCAVIVGCARKDEGAVAPQQTESTDGQKQGAANPGLFMAYERSIALEVEESRVAIIARSVEEACRQAADAQCVILSSQLETGPGAFATIKMRAQPQGIKKIIASLSTQGKVSSESVTAEDLAGPVADSAKRLELLTDYRSRLESLRSRASSDIEALIKVNQELAQVQSEIETHSGQRSHLLQRVATEILTVSIRSQHETAFWSPIAEAATDFGGNLSHGISSAITAIAFLLPWLALLALLVWVVRRLWSLRRRARGRPRSILFVERGDTDCAGQDDAQPLSVVALRLTARDTVQSSYKTIDEIATGVSFATARCSGVRRTAGLLLISAMAALMSSS